MTRDCCREEAERQGVEEGDVGERHADGAVSVGADIQRGREPCVGSRAHSEHESGEGQRSWCQPPVGYRALEQQPRKQES